MSKWYNAKRGARAAREMYGEAFIHLSALQKSMFLIRRAISDRDARAQ